MHVEKVIIFRSQWKQKCRAFQYMLALVFNVHTIKATIWGGTALPHSPPTPLSPSPVGINLRSPPLVHFKNSNPELSYTRYMNNFIKLDQLRRAPRRVKVKNVDEKKRKKILKITKVKNSPKKYVFQISYTSKVNEKFHWARSFTATPRRAKIKKMPTDRLFFRCIFEFG